MSTTEPTPACPSCRHLQQEVFRLSIERQQLIELLAQARERGDALYVAFPPQGPKADEPASNTPTWTESADKPLRYRVVDRLNEVVKTRLGPLHHGARGLFDVLRRAAGRNG